MAKRKSSQFHPAAVRGFKIGALSCGLLGFLSGIAFCVTYRLPVPPIAVTEIGLIVGGLFGGILGWAATFHLGRQVIKGTFLGTIAGLVMASMVPSALRFPAFAMTMTLGLYLGYQAGCLPQRQASAWSMRR